MIIILFYVLCVDKRTSFLVIFVKNKMVIWDRFTTKKVIVNEKKSLETSYEGCKDKWNRKWDILCVKIVGIASFSILLLFIIYKNIPIDTYTQTQNAVYEIKKIYTSKQIFQNNICEFRKCQDYESDLCCLFCNNLNLEDPDILNREVTNAYLNNDCDGNLQLKLSNCVFAENILQKNWYTSNVPLRQLILHKCNIKDIENEAFNIPQLETLTRLTLQFLEIPNYRKNMFLGLKKIKWLEIQNSPIEIQYEENVFEPVQNSLRTLQIVESNLKDSDVPNILSGYFPCLVEIDIRYNKRLKSLPRQIFKLTTPKLQTIHLVDNKFDLISKEDFPGTINSLAISLNPWKCTCDLYWLKTKTNLDIANAKCLNENLEERKFESIFQMDCSTTTTTATEIVTPSTVKTTPSTVKTTPSTEITTPSTEITTSSSIKTTPSIEITTPATEITTPTTVKTTPSSEIPPPSTITTEKLPSITTTTVKPTKICEKNIDEELEINYEDNGKLKISYPSNDDNSKYHFFFSKDIEDCSISPLSGTIEGQFNPDSVYTICKNTSNNLNCLSGKTLPTTEEQTWLKNRDQIPVILIGTFVNLFTIVTTAVSTYLCIRKHPSLLKGNKRIVIVKNHAADAFVMPQKRRTPIYISPTYRHSPSPAPYVPAREPTPVAYIPVRDASYFSPISDRYMYVRQRPHLNRSVSDLSMKTVASYITENQIMSWRKRNKKERTSITNLFEEPPPLPPPRNQYEEVVIHEDEILDRRNHQYW